ncbi:uncharacterized protein LOC110982706 [Acanthaster planci]|uniref:Uncharacterized protein LOC110982706 n=1 Tax=Acanthaster planci TaxID=133434 RepID=A0A8B7Z0T1_ACAPL|nr:uncharacterized protein LOC110982706 [Acanthaster planci]
MASSDVVIILGVLCAAFVIILILVAVFLCLRILKRRRKLKLRDDMERNRLLVDELIGNNNTTGVPAMAESVIVLPAQQEIDGRGNCSDLQAQVACSGVHLQSPGCPTAEEPSGRPSMPSRKADVKRKLHKRKRWSKTCTRDDAPSSNPTTLTDDPYRIRSKSLDTSLHPPSPTSPPLIRVGSWLSLDTESDASSAFSDSISASASLATRSEAEEAVEDTRPGVDPKRRKSGKSNKLSGRIALDYSIYYSSAESTLVLSVKGIKGIPIKYSPSCTSFVRVYLLPKAGGGYLQTCTVRNSLEPIFNDQLQFNKISLQEVWVNSLRFKLYVKGPRGGHHESLAEATRHCVMLIREADEVYEVTESLKLKRSKWMRRSLTVPTLQISEPQPRDNRHPTPMTHSPEGLRDLFVSIQYQPTASRFKVMVRKADHLSKGSHLPGTPPSIGTRKL